MHAHTVYCKVQQFTSETHCVSNTEIHMHIQHIYYYHYYYFRFCSEPNFGSYCSQEDLTQFTSGRCWSRYRTSYRPGGLAVTQSTASKHTHLSQSTPGL